MKKIEQAQQPLYAIAVPGDATDFDIVNNKNFEKYIIWNCKCTDEYYKLPEGNWQIVGTATKDHIDFSIYPYIKADVLDVEGKEDLYFIDYLNFGTRWFTVSIDSFRSLLTANGIDFNDGQKIVFIKPV